MKNRLMKSATLAVTAATTLSLVAAPQAFAAYDTAYDEATKVCTLTMSDEDYRTVTEYFSQPHDMVRDFALVLRSQLTYPEAERDMEILDTYLAAHPDDPTLVGLLLLGATLPDGTKVSGIEANKSGDRLKAEIKKLGYNELVDYRWFVAPPVSEPVAPTIKPVTVTLDKAVATKQAGSNDAYLALAPEFQELRDLVDEDAKIAEEFKGLEIGGSLGINSEKIFAQRDVLINASQEERDTIYSILGAKQIEAAVDDCIIRSQGRDPEEARAAVGSSDDIAKFEPLGWVAMALFILFTIAGVGYGWVFQNHPEWIGARA